MIRAFTKVYTNKNKKTHKNHTGIKLNKKERCMLKMYANACTQSQTYTCKHPLYPDTIYVTPAASCLKLVPWTSLSTSLGHTVGVLQSNVCTKVIQFQCQRSRHRRKGRLSVLSTPATHFTMKGCTCSEHSCYTFYHEGVYLFWALLLYILPWRGVSVLSTPTTHFTMKGCICSEHSCYIFYHEGCICSEHSCYTFCQEGRYLFWALLLHILPRREVSVLSTPLCVDFIVITDF